MKHHNFSYKDISPYEAKLIRGGMLSQACCLIQERGERNGLEWRMKSIVHAVETFNVRGA